VSDTEERDHFDLLIYGAEIRRAGDDELRPLETLFGGALDGPDSENQGRDEAAKALIHQRLAQRRAKTPTVWRAGSEDLELDFPLRLRELRAAREFVDENRTVWIRAATRYLDGVPVGECCGVTSDFVAGLSETPGDYAACIRCRALLVAHDVAWEAARRALPLGGPCREPDVECPALDTGGTHLPRALLRLALEADELAAQLALDPRFEDLEPGVPIASAIDPLWNWFVSLGPTEFVPGEFIRAPPIHLGPDLGTVEITRVVDDKLMEVSMPRRPRRKTLTREEMVRALIVERRDRGKVGHK
jgi:hypothetical protein